MRRLSPNRRVATKPRCKQCTTSCAISSGVTFTALAMSLWHVLDHAMGRKLPGVATCGMPGAPGNVFGMNTTSEALNQSCTASSKDRQVGLVQHQLAAFGTLGPSIRPRRGVPRVLCCRSELLEGKWLERDRVAEGAEHSLNSVVVRGQGRREDLSPMLRE